MDHRLALESQAGRYGPIWTATPAWSGCRCEIISDGTWARWPFAIPAISSTDNVTTQTARLLVIGAVVVLGVIPLCILGALVLLRGLRRELSELRETMDELASRRRDGEALRRTRVDHPKLAAFASTALAAHDDIETAIAEVRRLDEEEDGMSSRAEVPDAVEEDTPGGITRTRSVLGRLVLLSVIVLLVGQIIVATLAVTGFEKALEPQLSQKGGRGRQGGRRSDRIRGRRTWNSAERTGGRRSLPPEDPRIQRGRRIFADGGPVFAGSVCERPPARGA